MDSRTEDRFPFGQYGDFTSLFKFKIISHAREFYDEKTGTDDTRHFKFNNKKQV